MFAAAFALIARMIPAPVLVLALRRAADVVVFSAVFRASFGDFCSCFGILALPLLSLGYAYGVALFAPSAYSPLLSILRWLSLWVLAAGPHLWWSLCVSRISF